MSERVAAEKPAVKRLFVGSFLDVAQQEMLGGLRGDNEKLARLWQRKLRWVKAVKLHMTWSFLGDVPVERLSGLTKSLSDICAFAPGGEIAFDAVAIWPSPRKPRQLVLEASNVPPFAEELGARMRSELREFTATPDDRKLRPHITLSRFDLAEKEASKAAISIPAWLVLELALPLVQSISFVELIESHAGGGRSDYDVIEKFSLV